MIEIMKIAKKYNLKVIEDAAPSLGSHIKGKKQGHLVMSDALVFKELK